MRFLHPLTRASAVFDDRSLVSLAGLVPVMAPADAAGRRRLIYGRLTVATAKGATLAEVRLAGRWDASTGVDSMKMWPYCGGGNGQGLQVGVCALTRASAREPQQAVLHLPIGGSRLTHRFRYQ